MRSLCCLRRRCTLVPFTLFLALGATRGMSQDAPQPAAPAAAPAQTASPEPADDSASAENGETPPQPKIADEPRTIDPARLVHPKLAVKVTVTFTESSLREIAEWIAENQNIPVLLDEYGLSDAGIATGEPVTDRLDDEPVYLLLNRLSSLGVDWYVEDDVLHISTTALVAEHMTTIPYTVGDLLDAGFEVDDLQDTITAATSGPWFDIDGAGGAIKWLGDVLFVRHTDQVHREIAGLLMALREHGRRTFALDPPQHHLVREKLQENTSVSFRDTPLATAVEELVETTGVDIRIDVNALRDSRIRTREPVTLNLSERSLETILRVMLSNLQLTWILQDGVLWVTTRERADALRKTAVFDVRDLCRDEKESEALQFAIQTQTASEWMDISGAGGTIEFARVGTMVIRQTESGLREVEELLENYRQALLASKPRERKGDDPDEVITRYYRMHEAVAESLVDVLPELVAPETWMSETHPAAPGSILKVASEPDLLGAGMSLTGEKTQTIQANPQAFLAARSVLIIRQTRAAHEEIAEVLRRVEQGDPSPEMEGGGLGGGGFGGGFFSIPPEQR